VIGVIVTLALCALLSSGLATLGNYAISREFQDFDFRKNTDFLMDPAIVVRYAEYRLATNLFFRQALVLWSVLGLVVAYYLLLLAFF